MWEGDWRMPDSSELELLYGSSVNYSFVYDYNGTGINGLLVTGKGSFAGASLFLPAAGYCYASIFSNAGSKGYYSSRSLYTVNPSSAWTLNFYDGDCDLEYNIRHFGRTVRPVRVVPE